MWLYTQKKLEQEKITSFIHCGAQKEDYYNHFALAHGFFLTSRFDSFPLVMTEAAAFGLPIAAIDSGGVKEFVTDGCGSVVRGHDVDALAEAMKEIMDNPKRYDAEKLKQRAADFDAAKMSTEWMDLMDQII